MADSVRSHLLTRFNPRPPRGGRRAALPISGCISGFNPRPPRGGRPARIGRPPERISFNPRPPRGGRLKRPASHTGRRAFQSAPPSRGATFGRDESPPGAEVSIRAPLAGGDRCSQSLTVVCNVSIRTPLAGGDGCGYRAAPPEGVSIRAPLAGGDFRCKLPIRTRSCFNPRPPRGGRPWSPEFTKSFNLFQSAPPSRGATLL